MAVTDNKEKIEKLLASLDANLQFVSELLQTDIRLFVKNGKDIILHNYFHPKQDSIYIGSKVGPYNIGDKLQVHKDVIIDKAFRLGRTILGQYGLVINNRRIQEFAYPITLDPNFASGPKTANASIDPESVFAVIALERDIYLTRNTLGQHWDLIAESLIHSVRKKIFDGTRFPQISFGEGNIILKPSTNIFFVSPLAVNLLSEIAQHSNELIGRSLDDVFDNFVRRHKGALEDQSLLMVEEISLRQRTVALRHTNITDEITVVLIKDNSEIRIKDTLLKEIHHRVKNNLQTIMSLLRMQRRRNPELKDAFNEAINRTNSISLVHEYLAHSSNMEIVDFGFLVQKILTGLVASFGLEKVAINFKCPEKVLINSEEATNLALVLNEVLSNSLEHTAERLSILNLRLTQSKNFLSLVIEDDGGGLPGDFDYKNSTGLGWDIIRTITEESLKGKLIVENIDIEGNTGLKVELVIPID